MWIRRVLAALLLLFVFGAIGLLFWQQELQYILPTPIPDNYQEVSVNQLMSFQDTALAPANKPRFYHFFKPGCPCSRFNVDHFNFLRKKYQDEVDFVVVVPEDSEWKESLPYFDEGIQLTEDKDLTLANEFGVYSTPQAVIVGNDHKLYYRGNYNKARYCTQLNSNYAQMALDSLMSGNKPPDFGLLATVSYGCGLPKSNFDFLKINF